MAYVTPSEGAEVEGGDYQGESWVNHSCRRRAESYRSHHPATHSKEEEEGVEGEELEEEEKPLCFVLVPLKTR